MGMNRFFGYSTKDPFYISYGGRVSSVGASGNQNSGSSFNRFSIGLSITKIFKIEGLFWDINVAGTYTVQQVGSIVASPTILNTIGLVTTTGAAQTVYIQLQTPIIALPTEAYYFSILSSSGPVSMRRNSTGVPIDYTYFNNTLVGYDGTATTTGSMPVRIRGAYWTLRRR